MGDMHRSIARVALPVVAGATKVCQQQLQSEGSVMSGQGGLEQPTCSIRDGNTTRRPAEGLIDVSVTRAPEETPSLSMNEDFGTTQLNDNSNHITEESCGVPSEQVVEDVAESVGDASEVQAEGAVCDQLNYTDSLQSHVDDVSLYTPESIATRIHFLFSSHQSKHTQLSSNASKNKDKETVYLVSGDLRWITGRNDSARNLLEDLKL
ncbi:hypothetical protein V6N11_051452 [Hibiscus sabdariffa]|uniref:Uncharacterized protein n=1 Tax=Hibiscus sabdariffa TaxID=183260 RepID=A0ABR2U7E0_9ROSI